MAELLGIDVNRLFTITFAFGSGMAGIGGGLGADSWASILISAQISGLFSHRGVGRWTGHVIGVYYASTILGVLDFVLTLYLPQGGTIFIYALTILILLARPQGLFGRKGL